MRGPITSGNSFGSHGPAAIEFEAVPGKVGQVMLGLPLAMSLGLQGAMVVEIFPLRTRVTSMSFAYSVTLALAGGAAPMIATWLIRDVGSPTAPVFLVMLYGIIGLPIMYFMRETNTRSLDD